LAHVVNGTIGSNLARTPGAGAAGGLGFGLLAFVDARMQPGFELFSVQARLNQRLCQADVVLTAEGALDRSTLMGKGVGELARRCRELALPCIALAGTVSADLKGDNLFTQMHALTDLTSLSRAKQQTSFWLSRLTEQVAKAWGSPKPKR
jgi:glycerate kinase